MNHVPAQTVDVQVTVRGQLPGADEYAVRKVREALRHAPEPVLATRVRLTRLPGSLGRWPIVVQVNVDMQGRPIRAQARGTTVAEAVDLMQDRLRRRLERSARHRQPKRGNHEKAGNETVWASLPDTGDFYDRPVEEREIYRQKSVVLGRISVDEAVTELESMDYDFHLFVDAATGRDSVVSHPGDDFRLAQAGTSDGAVSTLRPAEAKTRLDASGERFVFFLNPDLGRGCVLYRRYDGHYGLIQPA